MLSDMGMMINRRRVCGGKSLPYDYEVEYLEGDGNAYIDTQFYPNTNAGLVLDIYADRSISQYYAIIVDNNNMAFGVQNVSSDINNKFLVYNGIVNDSSKYFNVKNIYGNGIGRYMIIIDGQTLCVKASNGSIYSKTVHNNTYSFSTSLYLFGRNTKGRVSHISICTIYSCKLYNNGVIAHDFIPVVKNNIGYMYDKVNGQLFGNAGSGSFVIGPRVS